jgi:hypothetical protein
MLDLSDGGGVDVGLVDLAGADLQDM